MGFNPIVNSVPMYVAIQNTLNSASSNRDTSKTTKMSKKKILEKIQDYWKKQAALDRKIKKKNLEIFKRFDVATLQEILAEEERDYELSLYDCEEKHD